MPKRSKGPRLCIEPARPRRGRRPAEPARWVIRDGQRKRSTGIRAGKAGIPQGAKDALRDYLNSQAAPRIRDRDPTAVAIADVIATYIEDVAPHHARPKETAQRLETVLDFFGDDNLDKLNKARCEEYEAARGYLGVARRELEDLRAAVRHHWEKGLCSSLTPVVLPERGESRERWLTRQEAARLLLAAWRLTQSWKGRESQRKTAQHVARFILAGLYTCRRHGAITGAALSPMVGRGWIDVEHGVFYGRRNERRASGKRRKVKKRQTSIRVPPRLLAHVRRWKRLRISINFLIEWQSEPVNKVNKAFRAAVKAAGLGRDVTPHTLRHTGITWLAQAGVPPHEICGFASITMEMFERVYAHHHPDYQKNAVNALSRTRQLPDRMGVNKRGQSESKVVSFAGKH